MLGAIKAIMGLLENSFSPSMPLKQVSKEQILLGSKSREGLSAIDIASKIINRKKQAGIPIGPLPSGAQNLDLIMETIRVEEIVNALLTKAKIEVAVAPGTNLTASGGNAGGPIVVQGMTTSIAKSEGIIR
tara:strand:+ start:4639 stop:5031 length:393 start_codon:yes stop_codon:yes gene_type:complete